jgi:hypothetical protein
MRITAVIAFCCLALTARASVNVFSAEVIQFKTEGRDQYKFTFRKIDKPDPRQKDGKFIVHLRYNPKRISHANSQFHTRKMYSDAVARLQQQIARSRVIQFGEYSSEGYSPIRGKPGEYQSEALGVVNDIVYAVHSDLGDK